MNALLSWLLWMMSTNASFTFCLVQLNFKNVAWRKFAGLYYNSSVLQSLQMLLNCHPNTFPSHHHHRLLNWSGQTATVVTTLLKTWSKYLLPANYRPISNLNNIAKVLEKLFFATDTNKHHISQDRFVPWKNSLQVIRVFTEVVTPFWCQLEILISVFEYV